MNILLNGILEKIISSSNIEDKSVAYLDLQGIIERYTLKLDEKMGHNEYSLMFSKSDYLSIKLTEIEFVRISNFLFYNALKVEQEDEIYFNAKCIQVLHSTKNIYPICNLIKLFYPLSNDNILYTLLRSIMDMFDNSEYVKIEKEREILFLIQDTALPQTKYLIDFIKENNIFLTKQNDGK